MGAWICPTCRQHYGDEARRRCPADGAQLVLNLSGASVQGHILTHLLHVSPEGSTLWEASSAENGRVALKLLRGVQDTVAWARAQALDHPHIVKLKAYAAIDDDLACVVMEWVDGQSLADRLAQGPLPVPIALTIIDQLLDALEYAHGQDVVHGDVHLSTVYLGAEDAVHLLDVGVRRWPPLVELLGTGGAKALSMHMVAYAAPERLALGEMGPRGDLYSVGALLWHLLTGAPPFGPDAHLAARAHLTAPRPRLADARPEVEWPAELEAFLQTAMASRPDARFASAAAMRAALRPIREATQRVASVPPVSVAPAAAMVSEPPPAPAISTSPVIVSPPPDNRDGVTTLMWVAGVGLAIIGLLLLIRSIDNRPDTRPLPTPPVALSTTAPATEPVERVKATPITAAPATRIAVAPVTAPVSIAPATVESVAVPTAAAVASAAPPTAPAAPETAAPASEVALKPVQVTTEPPAPTAAPASVAEKAPERTIKRGIARPKTPRRTPRRPRRPKKTKQPIARTERPATKPDRVPIIDPPKRAPETSEPRVRILGEDD